MIQCAVLFCNLLSDVSSLLVIRTVDFNMVIMHAVLHSNTCLYVMLAWTIPNMEPLIAAETGSILQLQPLHFQSGINIPSHLSSILTIPP